MTTAAVKVHWGRVVFAAIAAEVALIPLTIGLNWIAFRLSFGDWAGFILFGVLMVAVLGAAAFWACRTTSYPIGDGALVGLLAALIFIPVLMLLPFPHPVHEAINEVLKIVGGAAGGALVTLRRKVTPLGAVA